MTCPPAPPIVPVGLGVWVTHDDWCFTVDGVTVPVPKGFRFDRASIPKLFLSILDKDELGLAGPLAHDWLYSNRGRVDSEPPTRFTRRASDRVFRLLMKSEGVGLIRRWVAWAAVRGFGWVAYPPSPSFVRGACVKAFHTAWQAAVAVAVSHAGGWPHWTVVPLAAGLSLFKSLLVVPVAERVAGVLYE